MENDRTFRRSVAFSSFVQYQYYLPRVVTGADGVLTGGITLGFSGGAGTTGPGVTLLPLPN